MNEPLTPVQIEFVMGCVSHWMRICERETGSMPNDADAYHSALLPWLLEGNKAFPKPPPLRFSNPCYALAAGEEVPVIDFHETHPRSGDATEPVEAYIAIDQTLAYVWHNKAERIVRHVPSGDLYAIRDGEHTVLMGGVEERKVPGLVMQKIPAAAGPDEGDGD